MSAPFGPRIETTLHSVKGENMVLSQNGQSCSSNSPSSSTNIGDPQQQQTPLDMKWQSGAEDVAERRKMVIKIVALLQARNPDAPEEWMKKLPDMARRLEDSLYWTAKSEEEYCAFDTLKVRLQQLATRMSARRQRHQEEDW